MEKEFYQRFFEIYRLGNRAVKKAQEENLKNNIANVFMIKGKMYFELPDGTLVAQNALENIVTPKETMQPPEEGF